MEEVIKQFKIKAGTLRRLRKELDMYQKEKAQEEEKVQKLKGDGADIHDIRYAENILAESSAMIPDTKQRLTTAVEEVRQLLEEHEAEAGTSDGYKQAQEELELAAPLVD